MQKNLNLTECEKEYYRTLDTAIILLKMENSKEAKNFLQKKCEEILQEAKWRPKKSPEGGAGQSERNNFSE